MLYCCGRRQCRIRRISCASLKSIRTTLLPGTFPTSYATRWPRKMPAYPRRSARAKPMLLLATEPSASACESIWCLRISFLLWACIPISAVCSTRTTNARAPRTPYSATPSGRGDSAATPQFWAAVSFLGGHPFTIVGVTPEAFNGLAIETSPDIRVPAAVDRSIVQPIDGMKPGADPLYGQIFARLRVGVPIARASAEVDPLLHAVSQDLLEQIFPGAKGTT